MRLRELRREERQRDATLSEDELREVKRFRKIVKEGIRKVIRKMNEDPTSVQIKIWPPEREKK